MPNETVGQAGEDRLIQLMQRYLSPADDTLLVPAGDDGAVLRLPAAFPLEVLTTDLLVEGTHFLHTPETCWYRVGRRAVVANLSDLAAMGAVPGAALLSVGLPPHFPVSNLEELYRGFSDEARTWGLRLVGGDTVRSPHVVLNVAVTGHKGSDEADCARSVARAGDYLYVSGALGGCRAGLEIQLSGRVRNSLSAVEAAVVERQQLPVPRLPLGRTLATGLDRVAMMDVSDGIITDISRMATSSKVSFEIQLAQVPMFPGISGHCQTLGIDPATFALFSGEEFELLFACELPPRELNKRLDNGQERWEVTCIGRAVVGEGVSVVDQSGCRVILKDRSFHHFDIA